MPDRNLTPTGAMMVVTLQFDSDQVDSAAPIIKRTRDGAGEVRLAVEEQPVIMIQIADPAWTADAIHSACALARTCRGRLALVQMVRVQYLAYLGTDLGYMGITEEEEELLEVCRAVADDYGVSYFTHLYQYTSLPGAIAGAAAFVGARVAFASLPRSRIPFWRSFQLEAMRWRLEEQHCALVDEPVSQVERLLPSLLLQRNVATQALPANRPTIAA